MDSRPRIATAGRQVNLAQLAHEVGAGLCASANEIVVAEPGSAVTVDALRAALAAHVPDPTFGMDDERKQLHLLRAKAQEVVAGNGTFTAAQMQKIVAQLVLRATR